MPKPLRVVAETCGLLDDEVIPYGLNRAKVSLKALHRLQAHPQNPDSKLVLVTAISPTPAGEGKTVTAIGLGDGLRHVGANAVVCIREPSLGPVFGVKGGGAGGGRAQAHPAEELNLHFNGDFHAIAAAHNLLAALIEAHIYHGNVAGFEPHSVLWNRVLDVTDRSLREVIVGLGGKSNGAPRESSFDITAASEIMVLMSLSAGLEDMKRRLGEIVVGIARDGSPIRARDIQAVGAMAVLLRDALLPNLIQTLEGTPVLAHTGPFGNIATGCSSILADRLGLAMADVVVTEAGFGAELGFEKFCHIVAPTLGRGPDTAVVVATIRGIKAHSGKFKLAPGKPLPPELNAEDLEAIEAGAANLRAHLANIRKFGIPAVVAINRFPTDTDAEIDLVKRLARSWGVEEFASSEAYARGSEGSADLAKCVLRTLRCSPAAFRPLYWPEMSLTEKIETIATKLYGAAGVQYEAGTKTRLRQFEKWGCGRLPVCFAKTQYSFSHDPAKRGAPTGFALPITDVELAAGAGFVRVLCGDMMTMPGLPAVPAAFRMDVNANGEMVGVE